MSASMKKFKNRHLEEYFYFDWLKAQQVTELLEKLQNQIGKTCKCFSALGNYSRDLFDCEKNVSGQF